MAEPRVRASARTPRGAALRELTLVRMREFLREPEAVFWSFGFPLLLAVGLALAFRTRPPETIRVGVLARGEDRGALVAAIDADSALRAVPLADVAAAAQALRTGAVALVVVGDTAATGEGAPAVSYTWDPTRPDARAAHAAVDAAVQRAAGRRDPVAVREVHVRERGSRYIDFFIPGLLGLNLMGSGVWSIAFSVVSARQKKLLKRLVATPMSRTQYLLSFLLSRLVFLVAEVVLFVSFGVLVFDVPLRGSAAALGVVCLLGALAFSALGLLVASRARTVEAVSGMTNLVLMPMWILSGVFFSSANFPAVVQPVIQVLPLTATVDALRAIMLQGTSLTALGGELAVIAFWLVVPFAAALRLFRWR